VGTGRAAAGYSLPFAADPAALRPADRNGAAGPLGWGLRIVARGGASGVAWGTNVPLGAAWQTHRIPLRALKLFTQWDSAMAGRAGPHLRLSRLATVNVCFGKWLYPQAAAEPHGFEISVIAVEP